MGELVTHFLPPFFFGKGFWEEVMRGVLSEWVVRWTFLFYFLAHLMTLKDILSL